jgi:putative sigma-54 modulation protein
MNIKISSKGIKITEGMKQAVDSKFSVLEKFVENDQIRVSVSCIKKQITVCVMTVYEGKLVKIEKRGDDFYYLIGDIGDRMKEKLEKLHTKKIKQKKDQENALQNIDYDDETEEEDFMSSEIISKRKHISLESISPEVAVVKMEELGHESYIFLNSETGKFSMVYSRFNGEYGLIETDK